MPSYQEKPDVWREYRPHKHVPVLNADGVTSHLRRLTRGQKKAQKRARIIERVAANMAAVR